MCIYIYLHICERTPPLLKTTCNLSPPKALCSSVYYINSTIFAAWVRRGCNTLRHTAIHCNTLQHIASTHAHCVAVSCCRHPLHLSRELDVVATHCDTLQHTATHCNTLPQHTAHCVAVSCCRYSRHSPRGLDVVVHMNESYYT